MVIAVKLLHLVYHVVPFQNSPKSTILLRSFPVDVVRDGPRSSLRRLLAGRLMRSQTMAVVPAPVYRRPSSRLACSARRCPARRHTSRDRWLNSFVGNGIKSDVASRRRDLSSVRATRYHDSPTPRPRRGKRADLEFKPWLHVNFLTFLERCDWLQQLCLMNIYQHVRFS